MSILPCRPRTALLLVAPALGAARWGWRLAYGVLAVGGRRSRRHLPPLDPGPVAHPDAERGRPAATLHTPFAPPAVPPTDPSSPRQEP